MLLKLAAEARLRRRQARGEDPIDGDEYLANMKASEEKMYIRHDWPPLGVQLLTFYAEDGYDQVPVPKGMSLEVARQKTAAYARELDIVSQAFEAVQGIDSVDDILKISG